LTAIGYPFSKVDELAFLKNLLSLISNRLRVLSLFKVKNYRKMYIFLTFWSLGRSYNLLILQRTQSREKPESQKELMVSQ
jgi:hypothetical protein